MTTTRPYRKALDLREALRRLEDAAGSQLDETLVRAFVEGMETAEDAPVPGAPASGAGCGRPASPEPAAAGARGRADPRDPARLRACPRPRSRHACGRSRVRRRRRQWAPDGGHAQRPEHRWRAAAAMRSAASRSTCLPSFSVASVAVVSVKGVTSPAVHGWTGLDGADRRRCASHVPGTPGMTTSWWDCRRRSGRLPITGTPSSLGDRHDVRAGARQAG